MTDCFKNKRKYECDGRHSSACTFYEGELPESSELNDESCVTTEETTEELYKWVAELRDNLDKCKIETDCLDIGSKYKIHDLINLIIKRLCKEKDDSTGVGTIVNTEDYNKILELIEKAVDLTIFLDTKLKEDLCCLVDKCKPKWKIIEEECGCSTSPVSFKPVGEEYFGEKYWIKTLQDTNEKSCSFNEKKYERDVIKDRSCRSFLVRHTYETGLIKLYDSSVKSGLRIDKFEFDKTIFDSVVNYSELNNFQAEVNISVADFIISATLARCLNEHISWDNGFKHSLNIVNNNVGIGYTPNGSTVSVPLVLHQAPTVENKIVDVSFELEVHSDDLNGYWMCGLGNNEIIHKPSDTAKEELKAKILLEYTPKELIKDDNIKTTVYFLTGVSYS